LRTRQHQQNKKDTAAKTYGDYDWAQLVLTGKLAKLQVFELEKYLSHYKINFKKKTKKEKIEMIVSNIKIEEPNKLKQMTISGENLLSSDSDLSDEEQDISESEQGEESDFEVLDVTIDYQDESDHNDFSPERVSVTTRSGRRAKRLKYM
jgi:hypothetical protein